MYLARAFERRAVAWPPSQQRGSRPPQRAQGSGRATPAPPAAPPTGTTTSGDSTIPTRPFRRLSPAEQQERRRQGLCFNCDEPYVRGHVCQRLFYLEVDDFLDEAAGEGVVDPLEEPAAPDITGANALVVSLHALAGIRTDKTMPLPVTINGERLLALMDTGSTHNFLNSDMMSRLGLAMAGGEHLRVTVSNDDRLPCAGITRDVPVIINAESFSITCVGMRLGCFDFPMHELEPLLGSEARLLGKGEPSLLCQHADIAELLHMVKARQASYHLLGTEPLQDLEVKVPEALVPLPCPVVSMSSKTTRLCHLHIEDV
jgi:hypothetical protein